MSLKTLALVAALVVFIFLLILVYRLLIVFFIKITYGKYNPYYVKISKKFTGKSPYRHCNKDDFINHIAGFYRKANGTETFETNTEIGFGSFPFTNKYSQLFKLKGKPICVNLMRDNFFDIKTFGFRDELFNSDIRSYYHFIDRVFFMGEYLLKTPTKANIEEVSHILQKKYLGKQQTNNEKYIIKGSNDVSILFENTGFNLSIKYLYQGGEDINTKLDAFWEKSVNVYIEPLPDLQTELMEKL